MAEEKLKKRLLQKAMFERKSSNVMMKFSLCFKKVKRIVLEKIRINFLANFCSWPMAGTSKDLFSRTNQTTNE